MTVQEESEQQSVARQQLTLLQNIITLASFSFVVATIGLILYSNSRFGASGLETGALVSIGELMSALPRPLIGSVLDKYGRKPVLVAGIALIALAMALFAVSESVTLLLLARTVHGFGIGTMLMASYTMTADLAQDAGRAGSFGSTEQAQYRGGLIGGFLAVPVL
ncbi:MAG TPA: MFS transporter, partial [Thermoflexales bacterium]|nr:MFS transporter [Thermoflexales bacterium]